MRGRNKITINHQTMVEALQFWMMHNFASGTQVVDVAQRGRFFGTEFEITIDTAENATVQQAAQEMAWSNGNIS